MTARRVAAILMLGVILGIVAIGAHRTEMPAYASASASAIARE